MILSLQLCSLGVPFERMLKFCKNKDDISHVEPCGLYGHSPKEMVELLKSHKLRAQSFHFEMDDLEANWREFAEILPDECGARDFVRKPGENPTEPEEVRKLAQRLQNLAEKLAGLGVQLHYHNHEHEISPNPRFENTRFKGKCVLDRLLELAPGLHWQVDVRWARKDGTDVAEKMRQYAKRISMLHINDIFENGEQPARIGDGDVDFESIFAAAAELGISTFILENDTSPEDADAFADSGIELVQELVKKYTGQAQ